MEGTYSIFDIEGLKWDGIYIEFGTDRDSTGIYVEKEYISVMSFNGIRNHRESGSVCYDPEDCEEWITYKFVTNDFDRAELVIQLDGLDERDLDVLDDANENCKTIAFITFWRKSDADAFNRIDIEDVVIMNYVKLREYKDVPGCKEFMMMHNDEEGTVFLSQGYYNPIPDPAGGGR